MKTFGLLAWLLANVALGALANTNDSLILTPRPPREPRINGPSVYGARPGNPFLYRIPCTGERPMTFSARRLPGGLILDGATGIITGTTPAQGEYLVTLSAKNAAGRAERPFKIVAGQTLALTPPMGWNHWYTHYTRIDDQRMRAAADALIASGMADVGYQYVNIDDCWMNAEQLGKYITEPKRLGPARDPAGNLQPSTFFPDMRGLTGYIQSKGLKAGIYSSPGPRTCTGCAGSYGHEAQDAAQFAAWGFDFLKYDWCSYGQVVKGDTSLPALQKPFRLMGDLLKEQKRDIVFNLCQYGMGNVWEWGQEVGGHCWRTAGDLGSELSRMFPVALKNAQHRAWSRPGAWNDPDYLQIGRIGDIRSLIGDPAGSTNGIPCPFTPEAQYSYMSLWCLMAAPLFFSGDMEHLDPFTVNVLCNPEVIAIDQDPLGQSAQVVNLVGGAFAMVKDLDDGSKAVGLFNPGETGATVAVNWAVLGLRGRYCVRDLWRQQDLSKTEGELSAQLARHGVLLVRLSR
jgi:alpha-galactosidase